MVAVQLNEALDRTHPQGRVAVQVEVVVVVGRRELRSIVVVDILRRNNPSFSEFNNNRVSDTALTANDPLAGGVDNNVVGLREGDFEDDAWEGVFNGEAA